jgi:hypothetical protein
MKPKAYIVTGDALQNLGQWPAVFTSLPDAAEMGWRNDVWRAWFMRAARQTIGAVDSAGYAIFYQTDRRADGVLQSKSGMVIEAARQMGAQVVWHKIAVGTMGTSLFRPSYSHLICVSRKGRAGKPTPDVFMKGGKLYPNGTDSAALHIGISFLVGRGMAFVADPFCGRGSIGYAAAEAGLDSLSIDIDPAQTAAAAVWLGIVADVS